jgi:hypothetical protein
VLFVKYNYNYEFEEIGSVCNTNWEKRSEYRLFLGKPEGKRLLGRPERRWVDNIKMDLEA